MTEDENSGFKLQAIITRLMVLKTSLTGTRIFYSCYVNLFFALVKRFLNIF